MGVTAIGITQPAAAARTLIASTRRTCLRDLAAPSLPVVKLTHLLHLCVAKAPLQPPGAGDCVGHSRGHPPTRCLEVSDLSATPTMSAWWLLWSPVDPSAR